MSESTASPETLRLSWSGMTHPGRFRKNNEDAFLALTVDPQEMRLLGKDGSAPMDGCDFIFAVSDGMGGANAGEFASRVAIDRISHTLPRSFWLGAMGMRRGAGEWLDNLFTEIHAEMGKMSLVYPECRGMGATLSMCWFAPGRMTFAHVGDSRIYYMPKDGELRQISEDHTHVGWLLRTGQITESQARFHPGKSGLQQVLGGNVSNPDPQIGAVDYEPGDVFVLTTDGITDGLSRPGIEGVVKTGPKNGKTLSRLLIDEAMFNSGRDNLTALVIEIAE
ncbi:protein phosphatase 2C domain-containing protein [Ruficoccus sp. ZRK36]|uniref:PP2C family protein-serine/threonine phosphatase n=1 Tax=Ruficoccus sp. ZRK36 TaxID=2866311 RepID=UPI001C73D221|nr:protein phosphatase 2C domain-containing protein [Ruficoccus sp. ZRK36]QYY34400.1 protein phosphatase 2C domain-containing protein [Ruficoccus sp. ZRK36]